LGSNCLVNLYIPQSAASRVGFFYPKSLNLGQNKFHRNKLLVAIGY